MRLLGQMAAGLILVTICATTASAAPRCGDGARDRATVVAMEAQLASQCDCCGSSTANTKCVVGVVKQAMRRSRLSRMCARKVLRDSIRACPLASATGVACRVCNSDADCEASQFCECRTASCEKTGGVCVARPEACPAVVLPVCGCDGMTYANDCERQRAGACKRHNGTCVEPGGCFDTNERRCTGVTCAPDNPCALPDQVCSPECTAPPARGTCFDLFTKSCSNRSCSDQTDCLPNQTCLGVCPPSPVTGKCVDAETGRCSDQACGPDQPCPAQSEFCNPACGGPQCSSDADCDDGNGCTVDRCVNGACDHACICVGPQGDASCCPGPSALCAKPCAGDAAGNCGGSCPRGASCAIAPDGSACGCVSGVGGPCGGNVFTPPPVCAAGLVCKQEHPDATGVCVSADEPCSGQNGCGGPCSRNCADGTSAVGTCTSSADTNSACACDAVCQPRPTPTVGSCDGTDNCEGTCPFVCPDGTNAVGKCELVVLDPRGTPGESTGPMCRCFAGCTAPPTPTPLPCGDGPECGGSCTTACADGTAATGRCVPAPFTRDHSNGSCVCIAECGPPPTPPPTVGSCDGTDHCEGTCPFTCPDGTVATGKCEVVVLDPRGTPGESTGPMCRCFADCAVPPTPTPLPCGDGPECGGSCTTACADGSAATGQCVPAPFTRDHSDRACVCIAQCGPPPTPPPADCAHSPDCSGPCPFACPDGSAVVGKCRAFVSGRDKSGPGICACMGECALPTPRVCDVGHCIDAATGQCTDQSCASDDDCPNHEACDLSATHCPCGPTRTVPTLPHGTLCCQCGEAADKCFDIHWVEVTPQCPDGCTTVSDATCDASTNTCAPAKKCASDAECADGNACSLDRCDSGTCVHQCVCFGPNGECRPGPLARPGH